MSDKARSHTSPRLAQAKCDDYATRTFEPGTHCMPRMRHIASFVASDRQIANSESVAINHWCQLLRSVNAVFEQNENRIVLGAPEPVSEQKIIDNCFLERCPTKQGVTRAEDLRRRRARTMRLGRSKPVRCRKRIFRDMLLGRLKPVRCRKHLQGIFCSG